MKKYFSIIIAVLSLLACSPVSKDCVAVCGGREVKIIDIKASQGTDFKEVWSWKLDDPATVLPKGYRKYLHNFDDCKFVDGNKRLLLTSSGGGMVLLDIRRKEILTYAKVPMAHSADLLPGGRIAVALSTHAKGNALEIYDVDSPEKVIIRDSLYSGHGVVWNEERQSLYALGYKELRPFEPLKDVHNVKSVNFDPQTSRLLFTKGEISWWTHNIYQQNPDKTVTIDSLNVYKIRPVR